MTRKTLAVVATVVGLAVAALGVAGSDEPPTTQPVGTDECAPGLLDIVGLGCARLVAPGIFEVRFEDGSTTRVHGGDPKPATSTTLASEAGERNPLCAGDYRFQVLYGYASGSANRIDSVRGELQKYVRQMNARFNREAVETGAPSGDWRFDCDGSGQASVSAFAFGTDHSYSGIVSAARAAGHTSDARKYMIFADVSSPGGYSGVGTFYSDDRPGQENDNNNIVGYGITYSCCWASTTPMHEAGHNLGAVQFSAPDGSGAGHCDGYRGDDVLCYNDGGSRWDSGHACTVSDPRPHFDACHNDYFDYSPSDYLATHWNLANSRWVAFGASPTPTTTTTSTSTTTTTTTTTPPTCTRFVRIFGKTYCV